MSKKELIALIMESTGQYKKTHLVKKMKSELETIAMPFMPSDATVAFSEQPPPAPIATLKEKKKAPQASERAVNEKEQLMLATIPKLPDFEGTMSVMDGKGFLAKVEEIHGIPQSTSRALMVSLMKKQYYEIIGKKSGQKKTTIKLQPKGIKYLAENNLIVA